VAEGVVWMGRGCGGGALEPLQVVRKYENQRPKILPVDVCMYDVRRIMGYDEMGYKKCCLWTTPAFCHLLSAPYY
jgi:hypothetical protein